MDKAKSRKTWYERRVQLERSKVKQSPLGDHVPHWSQVTSLIRPVGTILKIARLYDRGVRNATAIQLRRLELSYDEFPPAFDG